MYSNLRSSFVTSAFMTTIGVLTLTSCSSSADKSAPTPTPKAGQLVDIGSACDGALRPEAKTAEKLVGTREVKPGPANYQASVQQVSSLLRADIPQGGGLATPRTLCAVQPEGSQVWLTVSFWWQAYHEVATDNVSTLDSSEYNGIGYAASSRNDNAIIDFSCRVPNVGDQDGRGMYILAKANTQGLNALAHAQKREAQVRVLHAASVAVATAMHCSTNLPAKLGALKALPLAK